MMINSLEQDFPESKIFMDFRCSIVEMRTKQIAENPV
jgi:hypothetical protein